MSKPLAQYLGEEFVLRSADAMSRSLAIVLVACAAVPSLPAAWAGSEAIPVAALRESPGWLDAQRESFRRDTEIDYPEDNEPNDARIRLGHTLFFDTRLSRTGAQSCASCHNPAFAWGDGLPVGRGDNLAMLGRRSPTIINLAWAEPLMWDGRAESLEQQALGPLASEAEMNMPLDRLVEIVGGIEGYREMFAEAFGDPTVTPERVGMAIAQYERTIVSGMAPFDVWVEGNEDAISDSAKRGFQLFVGKAECSSCHEGWRFTDDGFYDIGLDDDDLGRGAILSGIASVEYAFKTPGLRNVDRRSPYMHDGRLATLTDVVEHYNEGGVERPSRSEFIHPLGLDDTEVADVVAFLETLTSDDDPVMLPVMPH